jgi:tetratricopeptide (TPR) repeat protein
MGSCAALASVNAYRGEIEIPTYPWWPPVKHPYFRGTDGRNIYPYPMLDNLSRVKERRVWRTVVLENEYLKVTFLPELGGKVFDVLDKVSGQPMFYVNHVVKPGLIGQCGAWVSGGIEFNTGPAGHTVSAVQPVDVEILPLARDGSRSVAVGEVERVYRTRWTVVVTLRPGRSFLEERIRIHNLTEVVRPYYFWNCTAVPNPPGFRFVYPMTLGTDHGGTQFYTWPIADGKDLSWSTNYQDASSIFAYGCDQDFFGSYDVGADRGVVAYANHHQLPGKKAWTWGQGSYGTMHQMDLTDTDGPYNEVQTGPLLTQADVGRLDPGETVSWLEWWYPVRSIGGFTFANRDVAVNAALEGPELHLRALATGTWAPVTVRLLKDRRAVATAECKLSPRTPVDLKLEVKGATVPLEVEFRASGKALAVFRVPLELPARTPPDKRPTPQSAAEFAQAGWQDYLFARFKEAEATFKKALEKDPASVSARTGLAFVKLDADPAAAAAEAKAALETDPDCGLARFVLAVAESRQELTTAAVKDAWKAALDPVTAAAARALVAKLLLRLGQPDAAQAALSEAGPWQADPLCRNRLALACWKLGAAGEAVRLARQNLDDDPLDAFARSVLWLAKAEPKGMELRNLAKRNPQAVLDLAAEYSGMGQWDTALRIVEACYTRLSPKLADNPLPYYWAGYLANQRAQKDAAARYWAVARQLPVEGVFPHRFETVKVLEEALKEKPDDGKAALLLGHLLFALGRPGPGRLCWEKAAGLGTSPAVAWRALGMAALSQDSNPEAAVEHLRKAHRVDSTDAIVARDLARVLFQLADKTEAADAKQRIVVEARDCLKSAFEGGRGRSDFVALLARAHNRLGDYAETARLLDSVRITIWEGAREAHDLFEEAHLALGKAKLAAGRAAEALAEFARALEYPANLATGKLEHTREAHIHYLRGNALAALGKKQEARQAWQRAADEPASQNAQREEARRNAREALARPEN